VIVNYFMGTLGQGPFGHISPIAAYHEDSDHFLLLDVWPETKEVWVEAQSLWDSMDTHDSDSKKNRGWVIAMAE